MRKQTHVIDFDAFDDRKNPYRFLSNFYRGSDIDCFGSTWYTGEHAFQAMKTLNHEDRKWVADAPTPGIAKKRGRSVQLRDDWEAVKYDVMMAVIRAKFKPSRGESRMLLDTGDMLLVEGTRWGDRVWGVAGTNLASPGRNWLGTMLMARRAELRAEVRHNTRKWNERFVR